MCVKSYSTWYKVPETHGHVKLVTLYYLVALGLPELVRPLLYVYGGGLHIRLDRVNQLTLQ